MAKGWVLSVGLCAIWVTVTALVFHLASVRRKFLCMTVLFTPTLPALFASYRALPPDLHFLPASVSATPAALGWGNTFAVHVLLYCTLVMFFFHFTRSITLRILCEFEQAEGRFLRLEELRKLYDVNALMRLRVEALLLNGYVREKDGRVTLTQKGRILARAMRLTRAVFRMGSA